MGSIYWTGHWKSQIKKLKMGTDKKPSIDLGLIIPILLGLFSMFGICLVIVIGQLTASRATAVVLETATPFQYVFLGTEPGITTLTPEEDILATETETEVPLILPSPIITLDVLQANTPAPIFTKPVVSPGTVTPTSASTSPLNPGTYDEADRRIVYTGDWILQSGLSGVYQNSLHVSITLGDTVNLRFIGQQIRLFYQSGPGLGTIRIVIDGLQFDLDQSRDDTVTSEWVSALLINGTHTVVITHLSGGSVNLDSIIIPDVLITPTTTPTPTP
jgi:hypothetical protein